MPRIGWAPLDVCHNCLSPAYFVTDSHNNRTDILDTYPKLDVEPDLVCDVKLYLSLILVAGFDLIVDGLDNLPTLVVKGASNWEHCGLQQCHSTLTLGAITC